MQSLRWMSAPGMSSGEAGLRQLLSPMCAPCRKPSSQPGRPQKRGHAGAQRDLWKRRWQASMKPRRVAGHGLDHDAIMQHLGFASAPKPLAPERDAPAGR